MEKKFKILIVEDEGTIYKMIKNQLYLNQYKFVRARNVSEAIDEYEKSKNEREQPIDCYVIDLQIDSTGLSEEEMCNFYKLEGYAWMKNYVFNTMNDTEILNFKEKTIICSKYISLLERTYPSDLSGFILISKMPDFESNVKDAIMKICKK
jgi:hypothetical protein